MVAWPLSWHLGHDGAWLPGHYHGLWAMVAWPLSWPMGHDEPIMANIITIIFCFTDCQLLDIAIHVLQQSMFI